MINEKIRFEVSNYK